MHRRSLFFFPFSNVITPLKWLEPVFLLKFEVFNAPGLKVSVPSFHSFRILHRLFLALRALIPLIHRLLCLYPFSIFHSCNLGHLASMPSCKRDSESHLSLYVIFPSADPPHVIIGLSSTLVCTVGALARSYFM